MTLQETIRGEPDAGETMLEPFTNSDNNHGRPGLEEKTDENETAFARPFTTVRWISVCIGLYLTVVLYGM